MRQQTWPWRAPGTSRLTSMQCLPSVLSSAAKLYKAAGCNSAALNSRGFEGTAFLQPLLAAASSCQTIVAGALHPRYVALVSSSTTPMQPQRQAKAKRLVNLAGSNALSEIWLLPSVISSASASPVAGPLRMPQHVCPATPAACERRLNTQQLLMRLVAVQVLPARQQAGTAAQRT